MDNNKGESMPKERPILFSGPMVRALIDGSKTQTRRVCKSPPYSNGFHFDGQEILCHNDYLPPSAMLMDYRDSGETYTTSDLEGWDFCCPYGQPGDRLRVKESAWMWCERQPNGTTGTGRPKWLYVPMREAPVRYAADHPAKPTASIVSPDTGNLWGWRLKIGRFLPGWASRILLEIVSVRVERLNDCSEGDAISEGVLSLRSQAWDRQHFPVWRCQFEEAVAAEHKPPIGPSPVQAYEALWESLNGAGSWDANPWVWVVEFKRVAP